jgi:predicted ATPase/class 3 adenylate cyclase
MTVLALLFTDVVDSTQLTERLGDFNAAQVWAEHDRLARDLLIPHKGREIDRTDGFFLLFEEAQAAVAYALAYHENLSRFDLRARAALHVGAVHLRTTPVEDVGRGAKPVEVEGLAKPLTARILSLAQGGQTLLSAAAREAIGANPDGHQIQRHGHYRLKGVESPIEIFEIGKRGASPFEPPADNEKAYRVVQVAETWRPAREVLHNLPAERDSFVGRAKELRDLASALDGGTRLLTVVGTGGAGKTRLARRYGWTWLGDWPGGVSFCDLSACRSLDGVWFAIASALDVPLGKNPAVQLGHAMAGRGRCLLILDNFEQVIEYAGATVGGWLDRTANTAFLVTSRERLHLNGEVVLPLDTLPVATDSVDLFRVRAVAQCPNFQVTEVNRPAVTEIVRMLDGLPLAIELAAARVAVLPPMQLLGRLKDRFLVLGVGQGRSERQATLRNAIDWSWSLLTRWEQAALAQCSVFEGGFTLAAAEAVLDCNGFAAAPPVLDIVQALVDKSLLRRQVPAEPHRFDLDEPYFGLYVSIREYAREKLRSDQAVVAIAVEDRHGEYFATFGTEDHLESLSRHMGVMRRRSLTLEIDNLIAACRRAIKRGRLATAVATYRAAWEVLELQGPVTLAATLGRQLLEAHELQDRLLLVTLMTVALPLVRAGRMGEAETCLDRAMALSRQLPDRRLEGRVYAQLGTLNLDLGRIEQARGHLEAALAIHKTEGDRRAEGAVLGNLGNLCFDQGLMTEARQHYEAAIAVNAAIGNRRAEGSVLGNFGLLHFEQGHIEEALAHYEAALSIHREVGSRRLEGTVLGNLGLLHFEQGELAEARTKDEAALSIHRAVGNRRDEGIVLGNLGEVHFATGAIQKADDCYRAALAIAREVGYRRAEGSVLGSLAELLAMQGNFKEARESLGAGDEILRKLGDRLDLAKLLCVQVRVELAEERVVEARAALLEAEAIAVVTSAGPDSDLGREIAILRERLP